MKKKIILAIIVLVICFAGYRVAAYYKALAEANPDFTSGNGRLEATEVSVTAKLAGRIEKILVEEGDKIQVNQPLVLMQVNTLNADKAQAVATKNQKIKEELSAKALILAKKSEIDVAKSIVAQKHSLMIGAKKRYERSLNLKGTVTEQKLDDDESEYLASKADYEAAVVSVKQAEAELEVSIADAAAKKAEIDAAEADINRIQADIDDSTLLSTCKGRVQYRVAQPGEVLSSGGRVLNLTNLTDVYMTFFLPEMMVGKIKLGAPVRIVLDAIPDSPIPASVSFIANVAQFTPKTVETQIERQKLMFRIKAKVDPVLLEKYIDYVVTGLPGVAYVQINPEAKWPEELKTISERKNEENK